MKWNRKKLLAALRAIKMPETILSPEGIEKWLTDNGHSGLANEDGTPVDIKAAWAIAEPVKLAPADEPDPEVPAKKSAEELEIERKAAVEESKTAEARLKAARKVEAAIVHEAGRGAPAIGNSKHAFARKQYELRIKAGTALFPTADEAEQAGAYFRLMFATMKGWTYSEAENDLAILGKASSTINNTSAGVLVPDQYSANVMWLTEVYGLARQTANVQMFSGTDNWKRPRKTGILAMNHLAESAAITPADNTYDLISLTPKKVGALMLVSNELLDDAAVSVADEFMKAVAEAQAYREDQDYFLGDGSATYGGHFGLAAALPTSAYIAAAGSTFVSATLVNYETMQASVENINPSRCVWRCSRQVFFGSMKPLALAAGGTTAAEVMGAKGVREGADFMFLGDPGKFVQIMPRATAASTTFAYYGDFIGASMLGIHTELRVKSSEEYAFNTDQQAFRAISRIAVNIHGDGRATTVGPIAALKTTA